MTMAVMDEATSTFPFFTPRVLLIPMLPVLPVAF